MKKRVAISGGRDTVADFVQGGGSPPVKIGLNNAFKYLRNSDIFYLFAINISLRIFFFLKTSSNAAKT